MGAGTQELRGWEAKRRQEKLGRENRDFQGERNSFHIVLTLTRLVAFTYTSKYSLLVQSLYHWYFSTFKIIAVTSRN